MSLHHCSAKENLLRNEQQCGWMVQKQTACTHEAERPKQTYIDFLLWFFYWWPLGILVLLLWLWFFFFFLLASSGCRALKVTMNKRDQWGLNGLLVPTALQSLMTRHILFFSLTATLSVTMTTSFKSPSNINGKDLRINWWHCVGHETK